MAGRLEGAALLVFVLAAGASPEAVAQPTGVPRYSARQIGKVVELSDNHARVAVSIIPSAGNLAVQMTVRGHNILRFPHASPGDYDGSGGSIGIPFLAPWADRLDEQAFYANGRRYAFDMTLGNVRGSNPIHGFLGSASQWTVVEAAADGRASWVTSRLEFFRHPLWLRQFPFAHTIEMTHRLENGVLEVATRIENMSIEPMPVAIGFHPYFQLTDSTRDEWSISVAAKTHWPLENKMPLGTTEPIERFFPEPEAVPLRTLDLDDVFSDLVRDALGRSVMSLRGKSQQLDIVLGPNYRAVVIYAPKPVATQAGDSVARNFVCIEPVAGVINALNLAHRGLYEDLQTIPPAGVWQESFWIRASGF